VPTPPTTTRRSRTSSSPSSNPHPSERPGPQQARAVRRSGLGSGRSPVPGSGASDRSAPLRPLDVPQRWGRGRSGPIHVPGSLARLVRPHPLAWHPQVQMSPTLACHHVATVKRARSLDAGLSGRWQEVVPGFGLVLVLGWWLGRLPPWTRPHIRPASRAMGPGPVRPNPRARPLHGAPMDPTHRARFANGPDPTTHRARRVDGARTPDPPPQPTAQGPTPSEPTSASTMTPPGAGSGATIRLLERVARGWLST
jgi:hypothetical protein